MTSIVESYISCGVHQLYDMYGNGEATVQAMCERYCNPSTKHKAAFVVFSHNIDGEVPSPLYDVGEIHANYIEKNGIGKVTRGPIEINPNSGNRIRVYIVTIDVDALAKFGKAKKWK